MIVRAVQFFAQTFIFTLKSSEYARMILALDKAVTLLTPQSLGTSLLVYVYSLFEVPVLTKAIRVLELIWFSSEILPVVGVHTV